MNRILLNLSQILIKKIYPKMKIILLSFFLLFVITIKAKMKEIEVTPSPQKIEMREGKFNLSQNIFCNIESMIELREGLNLLSRSLEEKKVSLLVNPRGLNPRSIHFNTFKIIPDELEKLNEEIKDQSYELEINEEGIYIRSFTSVGAFYAAITLSQLIDHAKDNQLPFVKILDYPNLALRGVSDDISRGQVSTLENFKRIISHLARYKMNAYIPYIEDVLKFDKFPSIGVNRGALTKAEVKAIVDFAKQHFIEVIPAFQTLGHYENILSQEEFIKYAEFPGAASLCVSDDSVYIFLEDMLKEVFELFPTKYFHMGADESYDVGLGRSKHLLETKSLGEVHADHYKKVYDICKKYGKEVLMYGDIILQHPELLSLIPKDITIVDWHYRSDDNYPSTKKIDDYGFKYFVSPSVWNFLTTFPTNINALPNIQYIIREGIKYDASGMINSNWGDFGAETIKELNLYGYAWSAQCSWNHEQSQLAEFSSNYFKDFFDLDDDRLSYLYETFSHPFNQVMWHDVWRHPALALREQAWWEPKTSQVTRISWVNLTMPQVEKLIEEFEQRAKKNREHFEILKFLVSLNYWYCTKLQTQLLIQRFEKLDSKEVKGLKDLIEKNITDLNNLREGYKNIWLKFYKPDNLNMVEDKFNRLIAYFSDVKNEINSSGKISSPLLSSDWLYTQMEDSSLARRAVYQAEFELDVLPETAFIQLIADSYMKIFINDKYVDHIHARRSLSLWTEYKRIKYLDVKEYLKKGKNSFRFEVENFNRKGGAGLNLIGELNFGSQQQKIESSLDSGFLKWKTLSNEKVLLKIENSKNNFIIAPNFKTKRASWIER